MYMHTTTDARAHTQIIHPHIHTYILSYTYMVRMNILVYEWYMHIHRFIYMQTSVYTYYT